MNPCLCGFYRDLVKECTCSMAVVSRYQTEAHQRAVAGPQCAT
jgi:predicted ATPase with chaperone activity